MELVALDRLLAPLRRRVGNMIARAVVRLVNDGAKIQALQLSVLANETRDGVERFQQYGVTSVPHDGAEAIVLFVGGERAHGVAVAVDDRRYRKKGLKPGEVALYTDEGDHILLKRGRIVEVVAGAKLDVSAPEVVVSAASSVTIETAQATVKASGSVTLDAPQVSVTGNLAVQGAIVGQGGLAVSGGSGASVSGNVEISDGDVTADGISLKGHGHPYDWTSGAGSGTTGPAQ